jgi:RNA polymerase sigma factor (sigma-70 family)
LSTLDNENIACKLFVTRVCKKEKIGPLCVNENNYHLHKVTKKLMFSNTHRYSDRDISDKFIASRAQLRDAAARILGCRQRAEDVVQDAYVKLMDTAGELDIKNPIAYLFQIVRNMAIDRHRRGVFESQVFSPEEDGLQVGTPDSPEIHAMNTQHLTMLATALGTLPERTRIAFELYRLNGLTQREIAARLDISTTLVNFMIRDAMTCCRNTLHTERV